MMADLRIVQHRRKYSLGRHLVVRGGKLAYIIGRSLLLGDPATRCQWFQ